MRIILDSAKQSKLKTIFPEEDCLFSPEELLVYQTDASRISGDVLAVVRPTEEKQIVQLMQYASQQKIPIYPRARATNTAGGCVPTRPGIVISLLKMNKILEIDSEDFVAIVEPGVITKDLQIAVGKLGLMYPPDPASFEVSTLGGNIATCAGGMSAVKYGVTRDYLLATRVVLPDGRIMEFGARTHKNVVGLDINRLLCGSEGTLGIIVQMTLKLIPKPQASASVLVGFETLEESMDSIRDIFGSGMLPNSLEFIGEQCLNAIAATGVTLCPKEVKTCLLIKLDGSRETLPLETRRLIDILSPLKPILLCEGIGAEEEALWAIRRQINSAAAQVAPNKIADDVTVPRSKLYEALKGIEKISTQMGLSILTFGHVGDGNIHVNIMYDEAKQNDIAYEAKNAVARLIISLSGVLSGEHGIGLSKAKQFNMQISKDEQTLMRKIKAVFDPEDILNPGKSY